MCVFRSGEERRTYCGIEIISWPYSTYEQTSTPVTVLSLLLVAAGAVGLVYHLNEVNRAASLSERLLI